jgi:hypothetical protein
MKSWSHLRVPERARPAVPVLALGGLVLFVVLAARADARRSQASPVASAQAARALQGVAAVAAVDSAAAQAPGDSAAPERLPAPQELARLTYQREFFDYDAANRRDPFRPLLDIDAELAGPRFDELELTGLFTGEDGDAMVVVEDARRKGYFLKRGDLVGKATLVDIGADEATFEVRDYGVSRRETLKLQRPEETP